MISIKVKEDRTVIDYDYILSSFIELEDLMKIIYKPILGIYKIGLHLIEMSDIKSLLNNRSRYNHIDVHLLLSEATYKRVSLAMPNLVQDQKKGMWDYLAEGISERNLLISKKVVSLIYSSVGKSYEEIEDLLDLLSKSFGPFMQITEKDLSKHLVLNTIVYPRTVLISYINLTRWRKSQLTKCLKDISPEIVTAAMIKNIKKLHEEKSKYLKSGLGSKFIRELNTRNLNLMYYTLVAHKSRYLNDIVLLLETYERGLHINENQ
jgi:hypothetical protein